MPPRAAHRSERDFRLRRRSSLRVADRFRRARLGRQRRRGAGSVRSCRDRERPRLCAARRCAGRPGLARRCRDALRHARRRRRRSLSGAIRAASCRRTAPLHWIEDTGRWFAGPDGKPLRAHGVVRVIDERHEQEAAARPPVALRRAHRRDEPLAHDRGAGGHASRRPSSCARPAASCWWRSTISAASTRPTASTSPTR